MLEWKGTGKLAFALPFWLGLLWRFLGPLLAICSWCRGCWGGRGVQNDSGALVCVIRKVWVLASLRISIFQKPCIDLQGRTYLVCVVNPIIA